MAKRGLRQGPAGSLGTVAGLSWPRVPASTRQFSGLTLWDRGNPTRQASLTPLWRSGSGSGTLPRPQRQAQPVLSLSSSALSPCRRCRRGGLPAGGKRAGPRAPRQLAPGRHRVAGSPSLTWCWSLACPAAPSALDPTRGSEAGWRRAEGGAGLFHLPLTRPSGAGGGIWSSETLQKP